MELLRWGVVVPFRAVGGSYQVRRRILGVGNLLEGRLVGGGLRLEGFGRDMAELVRGVYHHREEDLEVGFVEHVPLLVRPEHLLWRPLRILLY